MTDNEFTQLRHKVLQMKAGILLEEASELENKLRNKAKQFMNGPLQLEEGEIGSDPTNLADAVIKGINDYLYRFPSDALERELSRVKRELTLVLTELDPDVVTSGGSFNLDEIKSIHILDFIRQFTLVKYGNKAVCPIHKERTASLQIYEDTNSWYCFGCQRGGSVIDFVMELEKCDFKTAVEFIKKMSL